MNDGGHVFSTLPYRQIEGNCILFQRSFRMYLFALRNEAKINDRQFEVEFGVVERKLNPIEQPPIAIGSGRPREFSTSWHNPIGSAHD